MKEIKGATPVNTQVGESEADLQLIAYKALLVWIKDKLTTTFLDAEAQIRVKS